MFTRSFNLAPGTWLGEAATLIAMPERPIGIPPGIRAQLHGASSAIPAATRGHPPPPLKSSVEPVER